MSLIELQAWLPGSDLSAAPDHTFSTDDQLVDAGFNPVLWGEGDGFLEIHADDPDAQYLQRRGFIRAIRTDTDEGLFWWILEEGSVKLLSTRGKVQKVIHWDGRGMLYYLDRYRLGQAVWAPGQPHRGSVDVIDYWTWIDQPMIAILTRFMEEGQYDTRADFLDKLEYDFSRTQDSNGNSLTALDQYQVPIRTGGLTLAADAMRQGNLLQVLPDTPPTLQAFRALSEYRTDRSSSTFASGKVRFAAGVNIATELPHKIVALRERTHTLTRRQDGQYATEALNGTGEPYMDFLEVPSTSDPDAVEAIVGQSHLNREKQSTVAVIRHIIGPGGASGADGYFPSPAGDYWLGDLVTVHVGTDEYDLNEQALEVAGIRYFLRGADWMIEAQLGAQVINSAGAPVAVPNAGPTVPAGPRIELCQAGAEAAGDTPTVEASAMGGHEGDIFHELGMAVDGAAGSALFVLILKSTAEGEGGVDAVRWRPNGDAFTIEALTRIHGYSSGYEVWRLDDPAAATAAGADVWVECGNNTRVSAAFYLHGNVTVRGTHTSSATTATPTVACTTVAGDLVLALGAQFENNVAVLANPTAGGGLTSIGEDTEDAESGQRDASGGAGWLVADAGSESPTWTFNGSRESYALGVVLAGIAGASYEGDGPLELVGEAPRAARCDHNHLLENLLTAETNTALVPHPDGAGGVEWGTDATGGGGGSGPTVVRKTANETVNGSTALQNDDHLLLALAANEVWQFELTIWFTSGATPDIKCAFTVPSGATLAWSSPMNVNTASVSWGMSTVEGSGTSRDFASGSGTRYLPIVGYVANGANAGNLQFQWAQNTSDGSNTVVLANSTLRAYQLV